MAQKIFEIFKEIDEAVPVSIDFWRLLDKDVDEGLVDEIYSFNIRIYDITDTEPVEVTTDLVLPGSAAKIYSQKYRTDTIIQFTLINGLFDTKYDAKFQIQTRKGYIYNEHVFFRIVDQHA